MAGARRVFRPRMTLAVCVFLAVSFTGGAVILLTTVAGLSQSHPADAVAIVVVALVADVVAALLGRPRAVADDDGLSVRNLVRSWRVSWEEVVTVRFGHGDPWVFLDLTDGSTRAVLAIQASDGARARRDAVWLRGRVAEREGREPGDDR